jgi:hypothetical protein
MKRRRLPDDHLESLWATLVYPYVDALPETARDKPIAAVYVILALQRKMSGNPNPRDPNRLEQLKHLVSVWGLLSSTLGSHVFDLLTDCIGVEENWFDAQSWDERERSGLEYLLSFQDVWAPPNYRSAIDPVSIVLPRWMFDSLRVALQALEKGEVHAIVQPSVTGRHDRPWTWDEMRARALEHVAFLCGQGLNKTTARKRVGKAMKNVSVNTLRAWEKRDRPIFDLELRLRTAYGAGKLLIVRADNPEYGRHPDEAIDASEMHVMKTLLAEPLSAFGPAYAQLFGARYNTPAAE